MRAKILTKYRVCKQCLVEKLSSEYHKDKNTVAGIRAICKSCIQINRSKDTLKAKRKQWRDSQDQKVLKAGQMVSVLRKLGYNITKTQYLEILEAAGTTCAICEREFKKTPSMDHCHATNKIRGIICNDCNTAIGMFKENKKALLNAIYYLESFENFPNKYDKYKKI